MEIIPFLQTKNETSLVLIRLMVGVVFISEGIQKFLFPDILGPGLFANLSIPMPEFTANLVGIVEIVSGFLLLLGFLTRFASLPLIAIMFVAISITKVDIAFDMGIWEMLHASRTEWAMIIGSIFILINGAGKWSFDFRIVSCIRKRHKAIDHYE